MTIPVKNKPAEITFTDTLAWQNLSFTWAKALDTKDFNSLIAVSTPRINVLYKSVGLGEEFQDHYDLPIEDYWNIFLKFFHHPDCEFISFYASWGHLLIKKYKVRTQHHLGNVRWTKKSETEAFGDWQIQVYHGRQFPGEISPRTFIGHSYVEHAYKLVEGQWKFTGSRPHTMLATEGDAQKCFAES